MLKIIGVDILLSGDNAVVIALACRALPEHQRKRAIFFGSLSAVLLRVIFSVFIVWLLSVPYLKLVGSLLLLWIGVKLLIPEDEGGDDDIAQNSNLWGAIRTIIIADAVMSLDNVIAIAAAADGSVVLLIAGLLISIPLIMYGSALVLKLLVRYPLLVTLGGGLLGWIAGDIGVTDPSVSFWVEAHAPWLHSAAPLVGGLLVITVGRILAMRAAERARPVVDLAKGEEP